MKRDCRGDALLLLLHLLPLLATQERQWQLEDRGTGITKDVSCLNNYGSGGRRVACTWQRRNQSMGEGDYYLNFTNPTGTLLCLLSASPDAQDHYSCSAEGKGEFTENDDYRVSLHIANTSAGKNVAYLVFTSYEPRLHILCDPPTGLQSNASASKCWIQWRKPEAYEDINLEDWNWQLAFKAAGEPWEQAAVRSFVNQDSRVGIDGKEFKGGVDYIARVRCKIPEQNDVYRSHWSAWSTTTSWKAPPGDDTGQTQLDPSLQKALHASLPLCLGTLLFLFLAFVWRMKDRKGAHIPTPATFFQPLYASHNGDFKGWAGLTGKAVCLSSNRAVEDDEEDPPGNGHGDKGHAVAVPDSRITFLTPPSKAEAVLQQADCPPSRGAPSDHPMGPQGSGKEPLFLPQGDSQQGPGGPMAAEKRKGTPLSLPSFPEPAPLFSCSNDYYCMWGEEGSSGPGALVPVLAEGPCSVDSGPCPGTAPSPCAPGQT